MRGRRAFGRLMHGDGRQGNARKRIATDQHFINGDSKPVLVGSPVRLLPHDQLRGHITWRSDRQAGPRQVRPMAIREDGSQRFGNSEIAEIDVVVTIEQDVRRLDVAMNEALAVNEIERPSNRFEPAPQVIEIHWQSASIGPAAGPVEEASAGKKLHDGKTDTLLLINVEHADDVGMRKPHERLHFEQEPPAEIVDSLQGGLRRFDHHVALEVVVPGAVDDAHPTFTEFRRDLIATTTQCAARPTSGVNWHSAAPAIASAVLLVAAQPEKIKRDVIMKSNSSHSFEPIEPISMLTPSQEFSYETR